MKTFMKRILAILLATTAFLLIPTGIHGQDKDTITERIVGQSAQISSIDCRFTQTKTLHIMNGSMVSQGRMVFSRPGRIRWEYTSPSASLFILDGTRAILSSERGTSTVDVNRNKMFKGIARMMGSCISGECLRDSKSFFTSIEETPGEWIATLVPRKKDLEQMWERITIHFDRRKNHVTRIVMNEKSGDRTVIEFSGVKINQPVSEDDFKE